MLWSHRCILKRQHRNLFSSQQQHCSRCSQSSRSKNRSSCSSPRLYQSSRSSSNAPCDPIAHNVAAPDSLSLMAWHWAPAAATCSMAALPVMLTSLAQHYKAALNTTASSRAVLSAALSSRASSRKVWTLAVCVHLSPSSSRYCWHHLLTSRQALLCLLVLWVLLSALSHLLTLYMLMGSHIWMWSHKWMGLTAARAHRQPTEVQTLQAGSAVGAAAGGPLVAVAGGRRVAVAVCGCCTCSSSTAGCNHWSRLG